MASGRPDYFKGVDITYQTLSEVTNRPKYGGAIRTYAGKQVDANAETEMISITGKGMIYGGVLWTSAGSDQEWSKLQLEVDGSSILHNAFSYLNLYGAKKHGGYPLVLTKFDQVNYKYSVQISHGITFEESLVIKYKEAHGATPNVIVHLIYALI